MKLGWFLGCFWVQKKKMQPRISRIKTTKKIITTENTEGHGDFILEKRGIVATDFTVYTDLFFDWEGI
jgi:hypothetical protein